MSFISLKKTFGFSGSLKISVLASINVASSIRPLLVSTGAKQHKTKIVRSSFKSCWGFYLFLLSPIYRLEDFLWEASSCFFSCREIWASLTVFSAFENIKSLNKLWYKLKVTSSAMSNNVVSEKLLLSYLYFFWIESIKHLLFSLCILVNIYLHSHMSANIYLIALHDNDLVLLTKKTLQICIRIWRPCMLIMQNIAKCSSYNCSTFLVFAIKNLITESFVKAWGYNYSKTPSVRVNKCLSSSY